MSRSTRRWSVGRLVLSWAGYWVAAAAIKLGPAVAAGWRAANGPEGQGNISVGFNGASLSASITELGATAWSGSITLLALALWIALPPLALWAVWMARNARVEPVDRQAAAINDGSTADFELGANKSASPTRDRV